MPPTVGKIVLYHFMDTQANGPDGPVGYRDLAVPPGYRGMRMMTRPAVVLDAQEGPLGLVLVVHVFRAPGDCLPIWQRRHESNVDVAYDVTFGGWSTDGTWSLVEESHTVLGRNAVKGT